MSTTSLQHRPWEDVGGLVHGFLGGNVTAPSGARFPRQVHGTRVVDADAGSELGEADAIVTARPGTLVGVVTADCVPILLLARERRIAAAVHAGWRGAAGGVLEATLAHITQTFGVEPAAIDAVIGPAIGGCCYEVGAEVRAAFEARVGTATASAWSARRNRDILDLRTAVAALASRAGLIRVTIVGPCTRCSRDYCSYRRDGAGAGRQASIIGWS